MDVFFAVDRLGEHINKQFLIDETRHVKWPNVFVFFSKKLVIFRLVQ